MFERSFRVCNVWVVVRVGAAEDGGGLRSNLAFTRSFQRAASVAMGPPRGGRRGGGGFRSGGGRGGRSGSRGSRVVSQADLDKDLDAYMEE